MKSNQITIKDIARELDISPSTVSRALKDHPDISPKTKKQVRELAEKLNYQPNSIALSLRSSKSNTIGVVIPQVVHFFFSTIISGIEDIAYAAGYSVMVAQSNESYDREVMDTKALFNNRVDGILVSMSRETTDYGHFESLHNRGIPMVFYDRVCDPIDCSKVVVDDFDGGYRATKHLIDEGYKRIAHLAGPDSLHMFRQRLEGYKKALQEHGLPIDESLILAENASDDENVAKKLTEHLLELDERPDAIFANNDIAALGAMITIKEHGLKIPNDMGIVGFSNWRFTSLTEPTITTVAQPGFEMGQEAARLLIAAIEAKKDEVITSVTKVLKTELVVRGSSVRG
ncbi:LacI family DNA-binding transcriptional regulator [Fulvivirga sp. 29W222]|uniref:LacI family DNA-binding transcriptional regulator n=1 Tax=Fulvivirga marina TaxID=2494733 RepID=A0A937G1W0_9BACT|nr:LacI family DNA-binding transcriptional regulator [Fulvivirga marina]MBL6449082.1 LacI family DNA-binding transcriptional regulator [Fulvivirga marina]